MLQHADAYSKPLELSAANMSDSSKSKLEGSSLKAIVDVSTAAAFEAHQVEHLTSEAAAVVAGAPVAAPIAALVAGAPLAAPTMPLVIGSNIHGVVMYKEDDLQPQPLSDLSGSQVNALPQQTAVGAAPAQKVSAPPQAAAAPAAPSPETETEPIYIVKAIKGHKKNGKGWKYLVLWEGYTEKDSTWEPTTNIKSSEVYKAYFAAVMQPLLDAKNESEKRAADTMTAPPAKRAKPTVDAEPAVGAPAVDAPAADAPAADATAVGAPDDESSAELDVKIDKRRRLSINTMYVQRQDSEGKTYLRKKPTDDSAYEDTDTAVPDGSEVEFLGEAEGTSFYHIRYGVTVGFVKAEYCHGFLCMSGRIGNRFA